MSQEFDLYMHEQIVEQNKRFRVDLEHYKGTITAQSDKIKQLKDDNELLYIEGQNLKEKVKVLEKQVSDLSALIPTKPL